MDLRPWLRFRPADAPDIYVLGFQELDLTAEAFIFNDSTREEDWSRAIEAAFHDGHSYRKVCLIWRGGEEVEKRWRFEKKGRIYYYKRVHPTFPVSPGLFFCHMNIVFN